MDPMSGFGLAANVLAVVDFSKTFLEVLGQVRDAGSSAATRNIIGITRSLQESNEKIRDESCCAEDNKAFKDLIDECQNLSEDLIGLAEKVCVPGSSKISTRIKVTARTMWSHSKIEQKKAQLEAIRGQLLYDIVVPMAAKINTIPDASALDNQMQALLKAINLGDTNKVREERLRDLHQEYTATQQEHHMEVVSLLHGIRGGQSQHATFTLTDADEEEEKKILSKILDYLYFDQVNYRYDDIDHAHNGTFEWIYSAPSSRPTGVTWSDFHQWACNDPGIYWVTGKAGSGKSTLMKLLATDQKMRDSLSAWAAGARLLVLSFYFWNPGTPLQKSLEGLFRSILLQSLQQCPKLCKKVFPDRFGHHVRWEQFPSMHQLKRAFTFLTTEEMKDASGVPLKLALFIDGLDEFDAGMLNHSELSEIFTSAAKSSTFKAILSSRPENAFEDAFRDFPKLRLHHLTRNDVVKYVNDRLRDHPRMRRLASQSPAETGALISEIVETAQGVFLWVRLVVRSLLEGLQNHDEIGILTQRLHELPADLEALFSYMLQRVPNRYKEGMSMMFQIMRSNTEFQLWRVRSVAQPLTASALHFALLDEKTVLQADASQFNVEEVTIEITSIEAKMKSHCAGLIELSTVDDIPEKHPRIGDTREALNRGSFKSSFLESTQNWHDPKVNFIHFSVTEYLWKEEVWNTIRAQTDHLGFHPLVATLRSLVLQAKKCPYDYRFEKPRAGNIEPWDLVDYALELGYLLEEEQGTAQTDLLNALETALTIRCGPDWWSTHRQDRRSIRHPEYPKYSESVPIPCHDNFFAFAVHYGLRHYVQARLHTRGRETMQKLGRPLLDYACSPGRGNQNLWLRGINARTVEALLQNGADPNLEFNGITPWQNAWSMASGFVPMSRLLPVLKVLLAYGADPNAYVEDTVRFHSYTEGRRRTVLTVAQDALEDALATKTLDADVQGELKKFSRMLKRAGAEANVWRQRNGVFVHCPTAGGAFGGLQLQKKCTIL